ncbi:aldehyde ferredoxin oxidoreductase family protein, partial [Chloroflexota bacterium]
RRVNMPDFSLSEEDDMLLRNVDGYADKLLRVDLTSAKLTTERLNKMVLRKYVGGAGLGAKFLYKEVPPSVDCFNPENRLILASGPLAATRIPGGGTFSVSTKGCLTGGATSSQANGFFGAYLKLSGFDCIIIHGAADKPVYLYIHDGSAELKDAGHLAGKDTWEIDDLIKEELGYTKRGMSVAGIGPAGENLVRYAAIVADKGHIAGHNGTGAVMGSKKLKAIAVARGKGRIQVADPKRISALAREILENVKSQRMGSNLYRYGTLGTYQMVEKIGALPIKNYTTNVYPDETKLHQFTPEYIRGRFKPKPNPCWACQMHHCHDSIITEGPYKGLKVEEPEFECLSAMGSQIGNMDVASAMMLTNVVDRLGLEMNETGWVIGLTLECYEKGLITKKDTDGLEMTWGNVEAVRSMIHKIAHCEGFGNILAEGAMRAAQRIGGDATSFAIHTAGGNTPRSYDHRAHWVEMFDKLTSNTSTLESRPFYSLRAGMFSPEEVVAITASGKGRMSFEDTLGTCRFATLVEMRILAEAIRAATGWGFDEDEAETVGLRIVNLTRAYNFRCGHKRELEIPSPRYGSVPVDGPAKGKSFMPELDDMLNRYYRQMGWDEKTGKPLPNTLRRLGLEHIIKDIW